MLATFSVPFFFFSKGLRPLELPEKLAREGIHLPSQLALVHWSFFGNLCFFCKSLRCCWWASKQVAQNENHLPALNARYSALLQECKEKQKRYHEAKLNPSVNGVMFCHYTVTFWRTMLHHCGKQIFGFEWEFEWESWWSKIPLRPMAQGECPGITAFPADLKHLGVIRLPRHRLVVPLKMSCSIHTSHTEQPSVTWNPPEICALLECQLGPDRIPRT